MFAGGKDMISITMSIKIGQNCNVCSGRIK